ncbi:MULTISPECIES: serine/threonine-protein kinase [unclassified Streptomyces]|uniref:serine/threonine-protein kinase n=1 Tax=unclassified Streptomyces TaxID=2593676 RepID=UPI000AA95FB1|nr:serine/threonine-protein kinase [Streptomyces sp. CB02058]
MNRRERDGAWDGGEKRPGVGSALEPSDPRRIGPYQLLGRLGAGGMGKVYLGRSRTGHLAAVKVLHDAFAQDPEFRRRFVRELAAVSRVSGRFTAAVLASSGDTDEERLWMATEYVPGPSLDQAVSKFGPLALPTLLALWLGLLGALESIHAAGVVHRDLKPSNVLLAEDGPRLIDFGISVLADSTRLTNTGMVIGTPGYMAPEAISGNESVPASDVFSLACMMSYAATGTSPFNGGNVMGVLYRIIHDEPDLSLLPDRIASLIRPCLEKDPPSRPSVPELINMLPTAESDEVSRLLAHGKWLPEAIRRQTREHAGKVFERDGAHASLPAPPLGNHGDDESTLHTGTFDEEPQSDPEPRLDRTVTVHVKRPEREPASGPPSAPPGRVAAPSDSNPQPPGLGETGAPAGPQPDPTNETYLRTHSVPLPADLPPLPRIPRRTWRLWLPNRRGTR